MGDKLWDVPVSAIRHGWVRVAAENETEARRKAEKALSEDSGVDWTDYDHQFAGTPVCKGPAGSHPDAPGRVET